jgi:hypothetical protein
MDQESRNPLRPGAGWRSRIIGVLTVLLSTLPGPRSLAADLMGVWLIDAVPFDAVIEGRFDIASYPVLIIDERSFRLYRMHVQCIPLDRRGGGFLGPEGVIEACYRIFVENRDGLGWGAWLLAEGSVDTAEDRVRFTSRTVAAEPQWWRHDVATQIGQGRPRPDVSIALWRYLEDSSATFYTTFHVGDGAWMAARVNDEGLVLLAATRHELHYRRSSAAAITSTMSVLAAFELSGAKYFRCLLGLVDGTRQGGPGRSELTRTIELGTQVEARHARRPQALLLRATGHIAEADRVWSDADESRFAATAAARDRHALTNSAAAGQFFGCPERDGPL